MGLCWGPVLGFAAMGHSATLAADRAERAGAAARPGLVPPGPPRSPAGAAPRPPSPESVPASPREWRYRVAPGDTLIKLAADHLADPDDWAALQRLNQVPDPKRLVPGSTLRLPYDWLRREATVADVVFVQGEALVQRLGSEALLPLRVGQTLQPGDRLRTGAQSSLSLRFADGSRLLVVPQSSVTLEHLLVYGRSGIVDTRVRVDQGSADTQVQPNAGRSPAFEVRTPAVNLGVRGTDFRVRVDGDASASRLEVLSGAVATERAADDTVVAAGFGVVAQPDRPIDPPRRLLPAPAMAAGPAELTRWPADLAWADVSGARGYRAQVFADGRPDALLLDGRFDGPTARWPSEPDLPDGRYVLKVRALDEAGLEGLDARRAIVLAARPVPPALQSPAEGAVVPATQVTLSWAGAGGGARHRLQVAPRGGDFSSPLQDRVVEGAAATLDLPPGAYAWRVARLAAEPAADPSRPHGPFSDPRTVVLRPVPPLPALEAPQFSPGAVLLRWKPLAAGQGVHLQLARDPAFQDLVLDQRTWAAQLQWPRPPAGTYHLRLRSLLDGGPVGEYGAATLLAVPGLAWWERWFLGAPPAPR